MDTVLRAYFDRQLEAVLDLLPQEVHDFLDESPLVVDDAPSPRVAREHGLDFRSDLCGLYWGVPLTEKSVDQPFDLPEVIFLFREGICRLAGCTRPGQREAELRRQIRITILHEVGHHYGLGEDDLRELGYD